MSRHFKYWKSEFIRTNLLPKEYSNFKQIGMGAQTIAYQNQFDKTDILLVSSNLFLEGIVLFGREQKHFPKIEHVSEIQNQHIDCPKTDTAVQLYRTKFYKNLTYKTNRKYASRISKWYYCSEYQHAKDLYAKIDTINRFFPELPSLAESLTEMAEICMNYKNQWEFRIDPKINAFSIDETGELIIRDVFHCVDYKS